MSYTYVGREKCGCVVYWILDSGDAHTAKNVADAIRSGCTIERVATAALRASGEPLGHAGRCHERRRRSEHEHLALEVTP